MFKRYIAIIMISFVLLSTNKAYAKFFHGYELQAGVDFPLNVGARSQFNFANDWYALAILGYAPEFLTSMTGTIMSTFGFAGEKTGAILGTSISGSIVLEARGGYRINGESGLYVEAGYVMLTSPNGGVVSDADANEAMGTSYTTPGDNQTSISSTFGGLSAHAGYTWKLADKVYMMADVGFIMPFSATATASASSSNTQAQSLSSELQTYIQNEWTNSTFIPLASAYFSYLF